jgi:hypothetical protein
MVGKITDIPMILLIFTIIMVFLFSVEKWCGKREKEGCLCCVLIRKALLVTGAPPA